MPSAMQKRSYGSVTVYFIDEHAVWVALERLVDQLSERPEVLAIVLFGSLTDGRLSVGSDVDLLLVLSHSQHSFLDRVPLYVPERFPVDVDVFPYTVDEIRKGQPLACQALAQGRVLWRRTGFELSRQPGRAADGPRDRDARRLKPCAGEWRRPALPDSARDF